MKMKILLPEITPPPQMHKPQKDGNLTGLVMIPRRIALWRMLLG
jgi:hypothetical protein